MDALQDDVQDLNAQLFLIASEPEEGAETLKLLDASPAVAKRISQAGSPGLATAIRCCVPLIAFNSLAEDLLTVNPREWRSSPAPAAPTSIQTLTLFALQFAQRLALSQPTLAELQLNLSRTAAEGLARLAIRYFEPLSRRYGPLLRLRRAHHPEVWQRLLIGDSCPGPLGFRIAQQTALLTMAKD